MENEYVVNGEDLVSVADAIREKSGTTEGLTFPDGFVETVGAIDTGKDGIKFYTESKCVTTRWFDEEEAKGL